jgi:periplasmic protein TonB
MITGYPTPMATWDDEPVARHIPQRPVAISVDGSWRYHRAKTCRPILITAAVVSAALHAALLFGSLLIPKKPVVVARQEDAPLIRLVIPDLKDLEEPETTVSEDAPPLEELAVPVPMQADVPSLPTPSDFVQPLNFASLLEPPDFSHSTLTVIPENIIRGTRLAERTGKIFNLDELDRHPEPVLQPAPIYPVAMRREGLSAIVTLQFVVDPDGRVLDPVVIESSNFEFNNAAMAGVTRWRFRAGLRSGRKVNVRMQVRIQFSVADESG